MPFHLIKEYISTREDIRMYKNWTEREKGWMMCEWAVESERQGDAGGRKRGLIKCESSCTLFLAKPWKCWNERALNLDSSFLTFLWLTIHAWQQVDRILGEKAMGTVRPGGGTLPSTQLWSLLVCPRSCHLQFTSTEEVRIGEERSGDGSDACWQVSVETENIVLLHLLTWLN